MEGAMEIISDPYFYFLAIPVVLLYGMAKGGLGPAIGAIAVPAMSFVVNPVTAAAVMLPILCVMDLLAVWKFRGQFSLPHLKILLPAGITGIIIASLLMGVLPADGIRLMMGGIVVWFCFDYWIRTEAENAKKGSAWSGYLWGTAAGFTSTQIHAGGAPLSIYLLPLKLDKIVLMGTMAIFFAAMNYIKLIPYSLMGFLNGENLLTSLVLMPLAPVGVKAGNLILHRVDQKRVYQFLYIALFGSGLKLVYDGIF